jgi:hypothetical protein
MRRVGMISSIHFAWSLETVGEICFFERGPTFAKRRQTWRTQV